MTSILSLLVRRASHLADGEPIISLFLCAALLAVFLAALHQTKPATEPGGGVSLLWMLCKNLARFIWALLLVALVIWAMATLRSYLRETTAHFQRTHGRVTQANYNAVQTIWGGEQTQGELKLEIYNDEEVTERIESEDTTKPAILRKKTVRHFATGNPFVAAHHDVTLKQNPRKKGSAFYGGYETDCRFTWKLRNPADAPFKCNLTFPLPADGAMYDDLSATLNGKDVLPQMEIKDNTLVLSRDLQPNEAMNFAITFKSRGMSSWYFQVRESREIRDFLLTLTLPDLPKAKLDYPYGCMTPTDIAPTADNAGCVLTYRLDHALSNKGMGISLPQLPQPGATTNAVLGQTETAWLLTFALLILSFTLAEVRHAVVFAILFGTATAFGYGLVGDFSDLLFGFWGTAALILLPMFLLLSSLVKRVVRNGHGKWLAYQLLLFGIAYPCLAGLDSARETLYLNLCCLVFLAFTARLLVKRLSQNSNEEEKAVAVAQPA